MVESVSNTLAGRLRMPSLGEGAGKTAGASAAPQGGPSAAPVGAVDAVELRQAMSVQLAESLAEKGPHFDVERVDRIKQAVAEGRYPIDPQRIADSIFQDYAALSR
jgi:negative regulator of flagellin synthesis FlgM